MGRGFHPGSTKYLPIGFTVPFHRGAQQYQRDAHAAGPRNDREPDFRGQHSTGNIDQRSADYNATIYGQAAREKDRPSGLVGTYDDEVARLLEIRPRTQRHARAIKVG